MKAAKLYGPRDVRIENVPRPAFPGPEEVVLRVEFAGLCGTDATQYLNASLIPMSKPHPISGQMAPIILGHEMVGTIVEIGSEVQTLTVGQRVVPGAQWWCGYECEPCYNGRENVCEHSYLYGIHADGGLAEFVRLPVKMCLPVPDGCSPEVAVLAQPLAVAFHALSQVDLSEASTIALFGVGGMGALLLATGACNYRGEREASRLYPEEVVAIDLDAERLVQAAALGTRRQVNTSQENPVSVLLDLTESAGVDAAIEATGNPTCIAQAIASLKNGGQMLQIGIPTDPVPLDVGHMVRTEKVLLTTNGQRTSDQYELGDLSLALDYLVNSNLADLISTQIIKLDDLVEHGLQPLAEHRTQAKILVRIL